MSFFRRAISLFAAVTSLSCSPTLAQAQCAPKFAAYTVNWYNILSNGKSDGSPVIIMASSKNGPALPVRITFDGAVGTFLPNYPVVDGSGVGDLHIAQKLYRHDQFTSTILSFNRHIYNAHLTVSGIDRNLSAKDTYSDTIRLLGIDAGIGREFYPDVTLDGLPLIQSSGSNALMHDFHQSQKHLILPPAQDLFSAPHESTAQAVFPAALTNIRIDFSSDPKFFARTNYSQDPGKQSIRLSGLSFCVPYGSHPGS